MLVILALLSIYLIWGSSYVAMRFAIESFPPFMMAAIRFSIAGCSLYAVLKMTSQLSSPSIKEWMGATLVGFLLLVLGNAVVAYAELKVSSSFAALAIATVPIWMALFGLIWKEKPTKIEWAGIAIGSVGVLLLNVDNHVKATFFSGLLVFIAAASWALGSILSKRIPMPRGSMASASQMLTGGFLLAIVSISAGEKWPANPSIKSIIALAYLIIFASLIAYSSYMFLLTKVRSSLATSNTFVNPVVAMMLGVSIGNERITTIEYFALSLIIVGVVLILPLNSKK